jgi:hypothetical protein
MAWSSYGYLDSIGDHFWNKKDSRISTWRKYTSHESNFSSEAAVLNGHCEDLQEGQDLSKWKEYWDSNCLALGHERSYADE